jgi:hypothetical protein
MKVIPLLSLVFVSFALQAAMGSSVEIPVREHVKYTFGNHKDHPVQKEEEERYLQSLAPMKGEEIRGHFVRQGYAVSHMQLRDISSELVYEVYATDTAKNRIKIYADPKTGSILKTEKIQ